MTDSRNRAANMQDKPGASYMPEGEEVLKNQSKTKYHNGGDTARSNWRPLNGQM